MVDFISSPNPMPHRPGMSAKALRSQSAPVVLDFPPTLRRPRTNADLARVIESEIIPRLMLAHAPRTPAAIDARAVEAFVELTLSQDATTLADEVEALMARGVALETVYVDLLIPAARRLGDDWNEDVLSFTDVTIGLSRLQQVVRALGRRFPAREADADAASAYFVVAPGEQHTFGLFLLEDGFRRAGWRTCMDAAATQAEATQAVAREAFDVFGLSATSDTDVGAIATLIARVRKASRNPQLFVMVGGRVFSESPGLAEAVGADTASDTVAHALFLAGNAVKPRVFA